MRCTFHVNQPAADFSFLCISEMSGKRLLGRTWTYFLKLRNSCQLASFSLKKWLLNIDLLVLTIRAENVMQLNRQLATECVCLVGSMCVSSQLSAPCSTGKWFLDWLPGLLCVSCLSYPAPDLSINHTVSKKAPIKLKGGLCYGGNALSGEREREVCCHSSWTSLYLERKPIKYTANSLMCDGKTQFLSVP